jgi:flagellin
VSRINTNIASLQAMSRLNKNQSDLSTRLQRLSSGLKINTGKDGCGNG